MVVGTPVWWLNRTQRAADCTSGPVVLDQQLTWLMWVDGDSIAMIVAAYAQPCRVAPGFTAESLCAMRLLHRSAVRDNRRTRDLTG
jgi:hypothetical protein